MKSIKVSVIGFGNIGRALVHLLINSSNYDFEINIIDPSAEVEGSFLDLGHAVCVGNKNELLLNDANHFNHSEFIFHCAGAGVPMGASRLDIASQNIELTKLVFKNFVAKVDSKIIVISNPVDVISYQTYLSSQLSPEKIIGTGTLLDSARMNYYISKKINKSAKINAILMGEHGQSIAFINSHSSINEQSINEWLNQEDIAKCLSNVKSAAHKIKMTQGSSIFGAVDCAYFIMDAILNNSDVIKPVSVMLTPKLRELFQAKPLFMSVLARINRDGAFPIEELDYQLAELEDMRNCAKVIGQFL